jgi:tRNA nucleotidyltransferase/poly(A) polymerase
MKKTYLVGGAVRDMIMGIEPKDKDYVVIGSSVEEMLSNGFQIAGNFFPVFLHPETGDEYALARTERKDGHGYNGFNFNVDNVTIEEDLYRRDFTMNAIAYDMETGQFIDPYNGRDDIQHGIIRHVSESFKEDPVRILRAARFSARYWFAIANETMQMIRDMVDSGEVDHLTPERVWKEFERGLSESLPGRFMKTLRDCGFLRRVFPCLDHFKFSMLAEESGIAYPKSSLITWGSMMRYVQEIPDFTKLNPPNDYIKIAALVSRYGDTLDEYKYLTAEKKMDLIENSTILRNFRIGVTFVQCCSVAKFAYDQMQMFLDDVQKVLEINSNSIDITGLSGPEIGREIRNARIAVLK